MAACNKTVLATHEGQDLVCELPVTTRGYGSTSTKIVNKCLESNFISLNILYVFL